MLVSLVPGGSLPPVALCQVSHKLVSTRDTRVMPREGRKNYERMKEKKGVVEQGRERERYVDREPLYDSVFSHTLVSWIVKILNNT